MKKFNGIPKVYLAGPDVFLPNAKEHLDGLKKICKAHNLEGLSPFDAESSDPKAIFAANVKMIGSADYVVANITPWRGPSCDVGTAVEIGIAYALGRKVFAYTADDASYLRKCKGDLYGVNAQYVVSSTVLSDDASAGKYVDKYGFIIEDFPNHDLQDNLMIDCAIQPDIANSFRHAIDNLMEYLS